MKKYKEGLKINENSIKAGYKNGLWYPHHSVEGGADTIGYGHKLSGSNNSKYYKGLSTAQVEDLLDSDILKHQAIAKSIVDKKYGEGTFDSLPQDSQMLLVDYAYNGVLNQFPTFTKGVVEGDKNTMLKEYKRYSGSNPLTQRNTWTENVINTGDFSMPVNAQASEENSGGIQSAVKNYVSSIDLNEYAKGGDVCPEGYMKDENGDCIRIQDIPDITVTNTYDVNGGKWKINNGVWTQLSNDAKVTNAHTRDRQSAYKKGKSERAFRNITPQGYGDLLKNLERYKRYTNNLGRDKNELRWDISPEGKQMYYSIPRRDDMFSLYLGLPQQNNSFVPQLMYRPTNEKDPSSLYYKPNYWTEKEKQALLDQYLQMSKNNYNKNIYNERDAVLKPIVDSLKKAGVPDWDPQYGTVFDNPLGDFTVTKGKDEYGNYISIYDKIDFNPFQTGAGASINPAGAALQAYMQLQGHNVNADTEASSLFGAGKPYEIYDRIYYDPKTKKVIKQNNFDKGGERRKKKYKETEIPEEDKTPSNYTGDKKTRIQKGYYDPENESSYMLETPDFRVYDPSLWGKYGRKYDESHDKQAYIDRKKRQYLALHPILNRKAGLSMDYFPEKVEQNFAGNYDYDKNTQLVKDVAKEEGWNPHRRESYVDDLTKQGQRIVGNSKFGNKLQADYWARSLAGLQELGNFLIKTTLPGEQGDVLKYKIPGLTKKEQKDIADSNFGALESLAFADIPGAVIANAAKNRGLSYGSDYKELPGVLSGQKMPNVSDLDATALNPFTWAGLADLPQAAISLGRGAAKLSKSGYTLGKDAYDLGKDIYSAGRGDNLYFATSAEAQLARDLKEAGLLGEKVDPKIFGKYPNLAQTATKRKLKDYNTTFRAVDPNIEKAATEDLIGMYEAGVNIEDPVDVAKYMSTHVPSEQYFWRVGAESLGSNQDALYTAKFPNIEDASTGLHKYGTYVTEVRPPMDFSEGTPRDWFNQYYRDKPFAYEKGIEEGAGWTRKQGPIQSGTVVAPEFAQYWPYVGNKGEKVLEAVRTVPTKMSAEAQRLKALRDKIAAKNLEDVNDIVGKRVNGVTEYVSSSKKLPGVSNGTFAYRNPTPSKVSPAIEFTGPMKHSFEDTPEVLTALRQRGSYWDNTGIPGKDLLHSDMITYHGTYSGRPIVEVKMPDGSSEMFYKSSGWAGKQGSGANNTTEGMWQVFGGHADTPKTSNWFIKDSGYKDYYGSKTFANMAENLDNALMQKLNIKSVDELDDAFNFQNRFGNTDSFIPSDPGREFAYKNITSNKVRPTNTGLTNADIEREAAKNIEWITSPEYAKRRAANTGETSEEIQRSINQIIKDAGNAKFDLNSDPRIADLYERSGVMKKKRLFRPAKVEVSASAEQPLQTLSHETKHLYSPAVHDSKRAYDNYPTIGDVNDPYFGSGPEQQVRHLNAREQILAENNLPIDAQLSEEQVREFVDKWAKRMNKNDSNVKYQDYDQLWSDEAGRIQKEMLKAKYNTDDLSYIGTLPYMQKLRFMSDYKDLLTRSITNTLNKAWMTIPVAGGLELMNSESVTQRHGGSIHKLSKFIN